MSDITHIVQLSGCDTATCGELTAKDAKAPIHKLARLLEVNGADPRDYIEAWRGDTLCITAARLGWWASHTIVEGDKSVKTVKYQPFNPQVFQ